MTNADIVCENRTAFHITAAFKSTVPSGQSLFKCHLEESVTVVVCIMITLPIIVVAVVHVLRSQVTPAFPGEEQIGQQFHTETDCDGQERKKNVVTTKIT